MPLINCEINLILTWLDKYVLSNDTKTTTFAITDTKLFVPVVTSSAQNNAKLLEQLKLGFKRTIKEGINRFFVLSFENEIVHTKYCLPIVEIKDCNVMIHERNFFDQTVKNNLIT